MTYFKPKNMGDVRLRLRGLDDAVPVRLAPRVQLLNAVSLASLAYIANRKGRRALAALAVAGRMAVLA
jgi:hypothetical protein